MARQAASDREAFQNLGGQHESRDHQRGKEFTNGQGGKKRDGHRQFHCHFSFDNILEGFLEDGIATDQGSRETNYTEARKWLPHAKPDRGRGQRHEPNADEFNPFEPMLMFGAMLPLSDWRQRRSGSLVSFKETGSAHAFALSRQLQLCYFR